MCVTAIKGPYTNVWLSSALHSVTSFKVHYTCASAFKVPYTSMTAFGMPYICVTAFKVP